ncbi:hypothetical protein QUV83_14995 [Cellulomonas cellasea]|uniref:hypothetical protein n=1 Tax=Cellulomonas cellasea TaxID=43670 RepID=UPI0025A3F3E2|nr:hypothetical protein [Cellulomonas cellasea]MDM8086079.1 hypothetical protein [Cellulomonas cellasea]
METKKRNVISTIAYTPRPAAPISGMRQGWSVFGATTSVIPAAGKTAGGFPAPAARGARLRLGALAAAVGGPPDSASHLTV